MWRSPLPKGILRGSHLSHMIASSVPARDTWKSSLSDVPPPDKDVNILGDVWSNLVLVNYSTARDGRHLYPVLHFQSCFVHFLSMNQLQQNRQPPSPSVPTEKEVQTQILSLFTRNVLNSSVNYVFRNVHLISGSRLGQVGGGCPHNLPSSWQRQQGCLVIGMYPDLPSLPFHCSLVLWCFLTLPDTHTCANTSCCNVYSCIICSLSVLRYHIVVFPSIARHTHMCKHVLL